jgi:hypothetical protein
MPDLLQRLDELAKAHGEARRNLGGFIEDMRQGILASVTAAANAQTIQVTEFFGSPPALLASVDPNFLKEARDKMAEALKSFELVAQRRTKILDQHPTLLYELVFVYRIALYEAFVSDVLMAVLLQELDALPTNSLIRHIAEDEVIKFDRKPVTQQRSWLIDKFNIPLVRSEPEMGQLVELSARRNLFAHNNGEVNQVYLNLVKNTTEPLGSRLSVSSEYWNDTNGLLERIASDLLTVMVQRFCPPGSSVPSF